MPARCWYRARGDLGLRDRDRAVEAEPTVPYDDAMRERLMRMVTQRVEDGLPDHESKSARRVLRREAMLASLAELGMIERTRGGRLLRAVKEDISS